MLLFRKKPSQGSQHPFNVKLLVTIFGAVCLVVAFLVITPIHAASVHTVSDQAKQPSASHISGGGCTNGDIKVCIHAKKGQVVSEVTVTQSTSQPAEVPNCPTSVTLKLFDNSGEIASTLVGSDCGHFSGPSTPIQSGDTFTAQAVVCFSAAAGDCAAVPSPDLTVS